MQLLLYRTLHNPWLRPLTAVIGSFIGSFAVNVFIVPQGFYTGGLMGLCQLIRTLIIQYTSYEMGSFDLAGILYLILNLPLLFIAYRGLGKKVMINTVICTLSYSLFFSIIPVPSTPIIEDPLTSCLIGGIIAGIASGIVLTCGCCGGGLDVIGLYRSRKGGANSVGRFSMGFNFAFYAVCLFLFVPEVVIYSVIYNTFGALVVDRFHQQNITVQVLIFTKDQHPDLPKMIMEKLRRGVTYWNGKGAYTDDDTRVLCVCVSKYEIEELRTAIHEVDPKAFFILQEGVQVDGNFTRKIG